LIENNESRKTFLLDLFCNALGSFEEEMGGKDIYGNPAPNAENSSISFAFTDTFPNPKIF